MSSKSLSIQRLEKELAREKEKHERTKRAFDLVVKERNEFDRLYTNLKFDYAEIARIKIKSIVDLMYCKHTQ